MEPLELSLFVSGVVVFRQHRRVAWEGCLVDDVDPAVFRGDQRAAHQSEPRTLGRLRRVAENRERSIGDHHRMDEVTARGGLPECRCGGPDPLLWDFDLEVVADYVERKAEQIIADSV